jgi:hypothetical protein
MQHIGPTSTRPKSRNNEKETDEDDDYEEIESKKKPKQFQSKFARELSLGKVKKPDQNLANSSSESETLELLEVDENFVKIEKVTKKSTMKRSLSVDSGKKYVELRKMMQQKVGGGEDPKDEKIGEEINVDNDVDETDEEENVDLDDDENLKDKYSGLFRMEKSAKEKEGTAFGRVTIKSSKKKFHEAVDKISELFVTGMKVENDDVEIRVDDLIKDENGNKVIIEVKTKGNQKDEAIKGMVNLDVYFRGKKSERTIMTSMKKNNDVRCVEIVAIKVIAPVIRAIMEGGDMFDIFKMVDDKVCKC